MSYIGINQMLLSYKMRRSNKEFELMQISNERAKAQSKISTLEEKRSNSIYSVPVDEDNTDKYLNYIDEIEAEYELNMADLAAWEDELQQKDSSCQSEINMLTNYISNWEKALQSKIGSSHTYGPAAGQ